MPVIPYTIQKNVCKMVGRRKRWYYEYEDIFVDVNDATAAFLKESDAKLKSNNRKETRRHCSLDRLLDMGAVKRDYTQDLDFVLEWNEYYDEEILRERLQKQVFNKFLTAKQADIFYKHKILKYGKVKIAKGLGITEGAVRKQILKAEQTMEAPAARVSQMRGGRKGFVFNDEILYEEIHFLRAFIKLEI